ncbi:ectoine synthase [Mesorhizobium sp. YC-2]|nr:ectoine synthase [Mesorhizobium sp. YC-2]MCV3211598.1 ectoine synthase [Mesorhizobium sp. YC-2]
MHYGNHLEAIYCISGTGSIEGSQADEVHVV